MKTITKTELKELVNYKCYPVMNEDLLPDEMENKSEFNEEIFVRGKLENLSCLNTCYRDTNGKVYVEDNITAIQRLIKRINKSKLFKDYSDVEWDMYIHEDLEYCLCVGEWDFTNAMRIYFNHYY